MEIGAENPAKIYKSEPKIAEMMQIEAQNRQKLHQKDANQSQFYNES